MLYCNMQMSVYFYTSFILIKCNETLKHLMYCERRMSWLLLLFDKNFSNNLQISSKYRNTMLSFCKISLKKYNMLEADENGRMLFLHNEFLLYIFKCQMQMEQRNQAFADKNFYLCQFNNKKHLLQCKVKCNDEMKK